MTIQELINYDKDHLWHPYTSLKKPLPAYVVKSAQGVYLELEDGRKLIDGMSSWWCAVHGYSHPKLVDAAQKQVGQMSHVMFGGITHRPAVRLAEKLVNSTPEGLECVFLADSGSVSVEVALKMAIQYQLGKGNTGRTKIMAFAGGYHGDTFGAMSVCDPVNGMHHLFQGIMPENFFAAKPRARFEEELSDTEEHGLVEFFEKHASRSAAFILEPIVQGAGGMNIYSPKVLKKVRALCDKYGVLLIADEIATGFGRTGKMSACNHANVTPDIMCVGKALTGGMMTMAATICTRAVAETISDHEPGVLMHGPTFMGNPLAASVACASLDLLVENNFEQQVQQIESTLLKYLKPLDQYPSVKETRVLGAIGVVECKDSVDVASAQKIFVENGVWIRPFRNLIYIMPPFIIERQEVIDLVSAIELVISA